MGTLNKSHVLWPEHGRCVEGHSRGGEMKGSRDRSSEVRETDSASLTPQDGRRGEG